jgi:tRNA (mo5U34)-methyltransferase
MTPTDRAMTHEEIEAEFRHIVQEDGPWTAGSFEIAPGLWTLPHCDWRLSRARFALRNACTLLRTPPHKLRVLDVGCLEGSIALHFAQHGSTVVGVDIRQKSLRKAEFVSRALKLPNVTWVHGDMLRLSDLNLGTFDLVLCFGTLYHVDAPGLVPFAKSLNAACTGLAIFDTHIAMKPRESYSDASGVTLEGRSIVEHPRGRSNADQKAARLWASADNDYSFWLTERSLANLLASGGFGPIYRAMLPVVEWPWQDRHWWLAFAASYSPCSSLPLPLGPEESASLNEPDTRPPECPLLQNAIQRHVENPSTQRLFSDPDEVHRSKESDVEDTCLVTTS